MLKKKDGCNGRANHSGSKIGLECKGVNRVKGMLMTKGSLAGAHNLKNGM
jgi:hypothetical protein